MAVKHGAMTKFAAFKGLVARFGRAEDGAATVDFVVMTAAGMMMGLAVVNSVSEGTMDLAERVSKSIAATSVEYALTETD